MFSMFKSAAAAVALAIVATASAPGAAVAIDAAPSKNAAVQEVMVQLRDVISSNSALGYKVVAIDWASIRTETGQTATMLVNIEANKQYVFAARCDNDCSDVDLTLETTAGLEIRSDRDLDDTPSFEVGFSSGGQLRLRAEALNCEARKCKVGVIVMERPTETAGALVVSMK